MIGGPLILTGDVLELSAVLEVDALTFRAAILARHWRPAQLFTP